MIIINILLNFIDNVDYDIMDCYVGGRRIIADLW